MKLLRGRKESFWRRCLEYLVCSKYWTNVSLAAAAASVMTVVASTKLDKGNRDEKDKVFGP